MGKVLAVLCILQGLGILFGVAISVLAYPAIVKIAIPLGMKLTPVGEILTAWVDVPISMVMRASLSNVRSSNEEGYMAVGHVDFRVVLDAPGEDDDPEPALYIQEEAEIDQIQRYVMKPGPLNYGSIISWLLAPCCLGVSFIGVVLALSPSKRQEPETEQEEVEELDEKD